MQLETAAEAKHLADGSVLVVPAVGRQRNAQFADEILHHWLQGAEQALRFGASVGLRFHCSACAAVN